MNRPIKGFSAETEKTERRDDRIRGIGFMCLSLVCFTGIDSSAKWLARDLPVMEISFFRYLIAFVAAAILFNPVRVPRAWRTRRPGVQFVRGLLLLGSTVFNFFAVRHLQLAETMAISFSAPLMIAMMAGPLLGERVGRERWLAILVGFVGVLVVARPSAAGIDPAMGLAFLNAACYAVYAILTRRLAGVDTAESMLLISAAIPVVVLALPMASEFVMPAGFTTWAVMLLMGLCGALGHFLVILAYGRAPAAVVAPFAYAQILWMIASGWLVFGDVPNGATLAGAAVVIASGLYLLHRETRGRLGT